MLFSILKNIPFDGTIDIVDAKGEHHSFGNGEPYVKIRFTTQSIKQKILLNPGLYLGEGYMNEEIIVEEGRIDDFINIITSKYNDFKSANFFHRFFETIITLFRSFQQLNYIRSSKNNVAHHYDINENLYKLFLDKDMQYSCAYFHNENINLDQAQLDKKNHIIKKLQIEPNMKVLDIGCGWGGMSLQIAKQTGAQVKGITLSENQLATAQKRAQQEGLNEKVEFVLQDYREEEGYYDRIVSVGMFEHVGVNYFSKFFLKTGQLLNDKGIFLLHTIGYKGKPTATSPWMRKYIFPGGYIPSLSEILKVCEKHEITIYDIEVLHHHYAHTLKHWYNNLLKNKEKIIEMFDKRFFKMWEFYLVSSQYSFRNMGNVVFQILVSKDTNNLSLTRNYMYN